MKRAPDTYIIIFFVVILAAILTYLVPVGYFETQTINYNDKGVLKERTVLIPESFEISTNDNGGKITDGVEVFNTDDGRGILNYLFEGMTSGSRMGTAVGVMAFVIIIGGAFGIIIRTGSIEALIFNTIRKYRNSGVVLIPFLFILFSAGGAIFGMGESAIAFAMIVVPLMISLGYDGATAVMITYMATQFGFATSWMNPFSVGIAQGIAEVPVMSGTWFRFPMWIIFTIIGVAYTWNYAKKIHKKPELSISKKTDNYFKKESKKIDNHDFLIGHKIVLFVVLAGIIWVIVGVGKYGYYIPEIATQFFIMGLVSGIIGAAFKLNKMSWNDIPDSFRNGAKEILGAALVVGMAKGIIVVLGGDDPTTPNVLNTILNGAGNLLQSVPAVLSAWGMYAFQSIFNFFVVSGSGQAALTMPIMAPLADIVEVSRQTAVLAYQLGDGFTNLIVPTSGALIGTLAVARIDWLTWAKFQIKLQAILIALSTVVIIVAYYIGFN